jgi:hypothetical protein
MKMKSEDWFERPRLFRLANVMYPHLAPPEVQREMTMLAAKEGKRGPLEARIAADQARGQQGWIKRR